VLKNSVHEDLTRCTHLLLNPTTAAPTHKFFKFIKSWAWRSW